MSRTVLWFTLITAGVLLCFPAVIFFAIIAYGIKEA